MFEHRKYHWLYFLAGLLLAIVIGTLLGCEQAGTSTGVDLEREPEPPIACCMAFIPSCMACQDGVPEDVWLEDTCGEDAISAEYAYWDEDNNKPIWLCGAVIIN